MRRLRAISLVTITLALPQPVQSQSPVATWTAKHQREIVDEFITLLAIPNVARNDADMRRNADHLKAMFEKRGFTVELQQVTSGAPVVFASLDAAPGAGTLALYIHYDGQPVDSTEWTTCGPFAPCVMAPNGKVTLDASVQSFDADARIYACSASDDKGPIMALLGAVDALRATGTKPG